MSKELKLKDLLKENVFFGGVVATNGKTFVKEEEEVETDEFTETVRRYSQHGQNIYRQGNLKEVAEQLSSIAEHASVHTIEELEDDFDKITVGRNMKELKSYSEQFTKVAGEAHGLQQRMESLYEDMGKVLSRYYEIDEPQDEMDESEGDVDEKKT